MQKAFGVSNEDLLLLHGGAGPADPKGKKLIAATRALQDFGLQLAALYHRRKKTSGVTFVVEGLKAMERSRLFNAGIGSCIQADGVVRVTAAIMDGEKQRLSGVVNAESILHPSVVAQNLQTHPDRVLVGFGAERYARYLGLPVTNLYTEAVLKNWLKMRSKAVSDEILDTVGCVVRLGNKLYSGTSTGGRMNVEPGRMSDAATCAGTYASKYAAISMTGIGEEISDDGVACRLETRIRDGLSAREAAEKTFAEALKRKRQYGWISVARETASRGKKEAQWSVCFTTDAMSFVVVDLKHKKIVCHS